MNYRLKIKAGFILSVLFIFQSCNLQQEPVTQKDQSHIVNYIDSVRVYHDKLNLVIPVSGVLEAWHKVNIMAPDTSNIISLLVEEGTLIQKNDLLVSLWSLSKKHEYTPIDLRAPISGVVTSVHYSIEDKISANSTILVIKNFDALILGTKQNPEQLEFIKRGQKVDLKYKDRTIKGSVEQVEKITGQVSIIIPNRKQEITGDITVSGYINCGMVKGDYILNKYFDQSDMLSITVENDIKFKLTKIGCCDSLALISPPLPDQSFIQIIKKNLDLIK